MFEDENERPNLFSLRVVTEAACTDCGLVRQLRGRPQRCSGCYQRARRRTA